jgi:peptide/nickel transport system substrate-binding protein
MKTFVLAAWLLCIWTFPCLSAFAARESRLTIGTAFGPTASVPDPAKGSNGWYLMEAGVFETLFALDFDMELVPCLADTYRNISPP